MAGLLEGKCAVITGAGRGQGREIALTMSRQGVKVVFLTSEDSRNITGQTINVDGGMYPS